MHTKTQWTTTSILITFVLILSACGGGQPALAPTPVAQQAQDTATATIPPVTPTFTPMRATATAMATITKTSTPSPEPATATATATQTSTPTAVPVSPTPMASSPETWIWTSVGPQLSIITASNTAPSAVDAAGRTVSYSVGNMQDEDPSTAWRVEGDGIGESLQIEFAAGVVRVHAVKLIPGYAKIDPTDGTDRFLQNRRITRIRLDFADGSGMETTLADSPEMQTISIPPVETSFVRMTILGTTDHGGRDYTAISDLVVEGQNCLAYCEDMPRDMVPDQATIDAILGERDTTAGVFNLRVDGNYARMRYLPSHIHFDPPIVFYQFDGTTWTVISVGTAFTPDGLKDLGVPERLW